MKPSDYAEKKRLQMLAKRIEWRAFQAKNSEDGGPEFVATKMAEQLQSRQMTAWYSA